MSGWTIVRVWTRYRTRQAKRPHTDAPYLRGEAAWLSPTLPCCSTNESPSWSPAPGTTTRVLRIHSISLLSRVLSSLHLSLFTMIFYFFCLFVINFFIPSNICFCLVQRHSLAHIFMNTPARLCSTWTGQTPLSVAYR